MEEVQSGTFSCDGCGATYKWKQQLAGKRVKCKCGHVMTVPASLEPADEPEMDALYALAEDEARPAHTESAGLRCPACQGDLPVGAVECPSCSFNLRTGTKAARAVAAVAVGGGASPMLGYAPKPRADANLEAFAGNQATELWIPIGLIAFGFFGSIMQWMYFNKYTVTFGQAVGIVGVSLIVDMVLIAIGCLAAIKLMDVAFGSPGSAALKVTAIAIAPGALANIIAYMFHSSMGFWVGGIVSMILYYTLFHVLFDLDAGEIIMLAGIMWVIRMWIGTLLAAMILAGLFAGVGGFGGGGSAGATPAQLNVDVVAEEALDRDILNEPKEWLADTNHIFGRIPNGGAVQIVNELTALGCKPLHVQKSGPVAGALVVKLPSDSKKLQKVKDWNAAFLKQYKNEADTEMGSNYLMLHFY